MVAAVDHCKDHIKWYEANKRKSMWLYAVFQTSVVGLSGLTPVLILWSAVPRPLQALPAALAAIAVALVGTFRWRDNQARFATAGETLKSELVYFQTRSTKWYDRKLDDNEALDNFVTRVESLVLNETAEWRADLTKRPESI